MRVPTAASCSCPSPACPAPFSCVQPPRKYLHFAKHGCTQIFAGRVQPSSPTLSYGYPHLGTLCRRVQLRPALSTCASLRAPSTPRPPTRPPPAPPSPPPPHTARHTYTQILTVYVRLPCMYLQPRPAAALCLPVLHPSRAYGRVASANAFCSARLHTNVRGTREAPILLYSLFRIPSP